MIVAVQGCALCLTQGEILVVLRNLPGASIREICFVGSINPLYQLAPTERVQIGFSNEFPDKANPADLR
jgi:hypothetical protein